jgi:DNA-binding MarR family transcriptional regulator
MADASDLAALEDLLNGMRTFQRANYRRRFFASLGLTLPTGVIRTLRMVDRLGAEPCLSDVASGLSVDNSTASRLVEVAVGEGYLDRRPAAKDMRRVILTVTPPGAALLRRADEVRRKLLSEVLERWSDTDVRALVGLLGRLGSDLDEWEQR